jgi:hypothetical protein
MGIQWESGFEAARRQKTWENLSASMLRNPTSHGYDSNHMASVNERVGAGCIQFVNWGRIPIAFIVPSVSLPGSAGRTIDYGWGSWMKIMDETYLQRLRSVPADVLLREEPEDEEEDEEEDGDEEDGDGDDGYSE